MALGSAHAAPIMIVSGGRPAALQRVSLGSADHKGEEREVFIQNLVHDHPEVIPMADIAPPFMPLVSVCKELPTAPDFSTIFGLRRTGALCWESASSSETQRRAVR